MVSELGASDALIAAGMKVRAVESVEELADQSRLIVTATSAHEPVLRADHVQPGTHITAMGSDDDGKQELGVDLLGQADRIVADSVSQCRQYGECVHAINAGVISLDDIAELGAVVSGSTDGRTSDDQITIADLTGVAVQDIQIAKMIAETLELTGYFDR